MVIDLPIELETEIEARAKAEGLATSAYIVDALGKLVRDDARASAGRTFKTSCGILKAYGISISEEEFAENRREMMGSWERKLDSF